MTCLLLGGGFSEEVDLSEFKCSFLLTEHLSAEIPLCLEVTKVCITHLNFCFIIKLYFYDTNTF